MLLQRASAGSGKTFKLAKTYIRLFISRKEEGADFYRLLSPGEVRDAHTHILGVTFTNKATNEMKQRIVEKLAALSAPVPVKGMEPEGYRFPDYLLEFTGESELADPIEDVIYVTKGIPATRHEITQTCRAALSSLLNNYSNFNISTIDSFFQGVLRTLAYELHLNDTYHVELNDDYLAQVGVNDTLTAVKETSPDKGIRADMAAYMTRWLETVMRRRLQQGETWDAFSKRSNTGIYGELVAIAGKMSREDFKKYIAEMEDYFSTPDRFMNFYSGVLRASGEVTKLHEECKHTVRNFLAGTNSASYQRGVESAMLSILNASPHSAVKSNKKLECNRTGMEQGKNSPFLAKSAEKNSPEAQRLFTAVCDTFYTWQESRTYWATILSRLHYLGALYYINSSIDAYREENNIIPLSATNEILGKIIGKDEVPFIYERTGVRLRHFLLDEFQDTSRLQWKNLRPLLEQSDAYGNENLIIGDAKQSIYRFRNADPELINSGVQEDFPLTNVLPDSLAEGSIEREAVNTNWRSASHIVRFNNSLFTTIAPLLDCEEDTDKHIFSHLYNNVVQTVKKRDTPGFVKIDFSRDNSYDTLGTLIDSLRERGYSMSNIAILTNKRSEGQEAIQAVLEYNKIKKQEAEAEGKTYTAIEFISEESLLVKESPAVKVIVSVMTLIANDFIVPGSEHDPKATAADKLHLRPYELSRIEANFNIGLSNGKISSLSDLDNIDRTVSSEEIQALYRRMGATTLPAMVESIASAFLGDSLLHSQVAYISAFQDIVLEYCESYTPDLNSFLTWWKENGHKFSIAAPEGVEAVNVMTVHKSKGLEFEVVIMPKVDWNLAPEKEDLEIIWIKHQPKGLTPEEAADTPDFIPVTPRQSVMNTPDSPFYSEYHKFFIESRTDQLNKTYVAFTRAVKELYITAPAGKEGSQKVGRYMKDALTYLLSQSSDDHNPDLIDREESALIDDVYTYGIPLHSVTAKKKEEDTEIIKIERYAPHSPLTASSALFTLTNDKNTDL